jgi:hypothetical protein
MANTTNQGWTKPTVGGSEDTWGTTINAAIDAIDTLVGSVTAAEVAVLDGLTATTAELNYVDGVTSAIQPQIDTLTSSVAAVAVIPTGAIILWSGAANAIPSGYALCDGANNTPNLQNRFVIGAGDTYSVNATGGSADASVVSHTHDLTAASTDTHNISGTFTASKPQAATGAFSVVGGQAGGADGGQSSAGLYTLSDNHNHGITGSTDSAGSSGTNANLPPYYALCYIMKT